MRAVYLVGLVAACKQEPASSPAPARDAAPEVAALGSAAPGSAAAPPAPAVPQSPPPPIPPGFAAVKLDATVALDVAPPTWGKDPRRERARVTVKQMRDLMSEPKLRGPADLDESWDLELPRAVGPATSATASFWWRPEPGCEVLVLRFAREVDDSQVQSLVLLRPTAVSSSFARSDAIGGNAAHGCAAYDVFSGVALGEDGRDLWAFAACVDHASVSDGDRHPTLEAGGPTHIRCATGQLVVGGTRWSATSDW